MELMSDQETEQATGAPPEQEEFREEDLPLPPPTFEFLTLSFKTQAEMHLGLLHFGEEKDRPKPQLRLARHAIDLLAMLLDKTKGNLTIDEQRLIENSLTELRFRYVAAMEQSKQS
jgi:Domain of unknown function (DUF1844)